MINQDKALKLVKIYTYIYDVYENDLQFTCERFSNNNQPKLTDQEIMTIYLFCVNEERRFKIIEIHRFASDYLRSWFPDLGSYEAFNNRINRLSESFKLLGEALISSFKPEGISSNHSLLDSMPIVTCSGKRQGKVARELTNKGYCSTKSMYYFGVKLHALAFRCDKKLPFPEQLLISTASENDLNVFKNAWSNIRNRVFFGDKIYCNKDFFDQLLKEKNAEMLTPIKEVKGQCDVIKKMDKAFNNLYSRAVSAIRQPIEGLFNWIIEKTNIQKASKVRSTKGLLVHMFGKIAAAFIGLIF